MVTAIALIEAEASRSPHLADVIGDRNRCAVCIVATESVMAFRACPGSDLEAGFELGLD